MDYNSLEFNDYNDYELQRLEFLADQYSYSVAVVLMMNRQNLTF